MLMLDLTSHFVETLSTHDLFAEPPWLTVAIEIVMFAAISDVYVVFTTTNFFYFILCTRDLTMKTTAGKKYHCC